MTSAARFPAEFEIVAGARVRKSRAGEQARRVVAASKLCKGSAPTLHSFVIPSWRDVEAECRSRDANKAVSHKKESSK